MRVSCHYHMRHVIDYHALNSSGKFLEILRVSNVYFVDSSVVGLRQLVELPKFFKPVYRAGSNRIWPDRIACKQGTRFLHCTL